MNGGHGGHFARGAYRTESGLSACFTFFRPIQAAARHRVQAPAAAGPRRWTGCSPAPRRSFGRTFNRCRNSGSKRVNRLSMKGCFYEDSFVKPFFDRGIDGWDIMGPARRHVGYVAWGDSLQRCILIRGRGVTSVRASARTNFYPCRTCRSGTRCSMRARRLDKPQLPTRPFFEDGPHVGTRGHYGRVDL